MGSLHLKTPHHFQKGSNLTHNIPSTLPTPVKPREFEKLLKGFQKKEFIVQGFTEGFKINFEGIDESMEARNSRVAVLNPTAVSDKIRKEVEFLKDLYIVVIVTI